MRTNRNNSGKPDTRRDPYSHEATQPSRYILGISAGQRYRTSRPATALPISIRWISEVPSKIVKI